MNRGADALWDARKGSGEESGTSKVGAALRSPVAVLAGRKTALPEDMRGSWLLLAWFSRSDEPGLRYRGKQRVYSRGCSGMQQMDNSGDYRLGRYGTYSSGCLSIGPAMMRGGKDRTSSSPLSLGACPWIYTTHPPQHHPRLDRQQGPELGRGPYHCARGFVPFPPASHMNRGGRCGQNITELKMDPW